MVFSATTAYASWIVVAKQKMIGIETVATEIPLYIVSMPILIGFVLMFSMLQ
jgi:TRAP-type C4-dicarboxylate transport system permease small subunit